MRLTLRLVSGFVGGIAVVLAIYALDVFRRETDAFQQDMRHDDANTGRVFASMLCDSFNRDGFNSAMDLIEAENSVHGTVGLGWIWLDDPNVRLSAEVRTALQNGQTISENTDENTRDAAVKTYVPLLKLNSPRKAALELSESLAEQRSYTRQTLTRIGVTTASIVFVMGMFALALGIRFVGRPVQRLIDGIRHVASGDFSHRLNYRTPDEFGTLAREFDAICDQLAVARATAAAETQARMRAMEQLRHADRLRTVGQLTAGIAHELGTPLNVAWARARMIAESEVTGPAAIECARIVVEQTRRMTNIIRQLLQFARPRSPRKGPVDLGSIAEQTTNLLGATARQHGVTLVLERAAELVVDVDADQIQQVTSNLVMNAIQAMPSGGTATISIAQAQATPPADHGGQPGRWAVLRVRDGGAGIAPENLDRVFEPFFTTKDVGEGTGLGLSVSRGIIQEHGGWISVESTLGKGACFDVHLPLGSGSCAGAS